jgi:hypothetical protein
MELLPDFEISDTVTLPVGLDKFWSHFFEDGAPCCFTVFWQREKEATAITTTKWQPQMPNNDSKNHSKQNDNWQFGFTASHPVQKARILGATIPVKGVPMVSSAQVRKFQMLVRQDAQGV